MLNKLEKTFGRLAVPKLMNYVIGCYVVGYIIMIFDRSGEFSSLLQLEPYMIIHHLQIWRIFTWVLSPPTSSIFFAIIMMIFYWQLGRNLEAMWGTFRFNFYMFSGFLFTVAGAFILYAVLRAGGFADIYQMMDSAGNIATFRMSEHMGGYFSTSYINMSIFLAFSLSVPDMQVMLYFFIPIKMGWLAIIYAVLTVVSFISTGLPGRVSIISSLLNFIIFFLATRRFRFSNLKDAKRRYDYRRATRGPTRGPFGGGFGAGPSNEGEGRDRQQSSQQQSSQQQRQEENKAYRSRTVQISRHRCSVCGRTEITNPELEFRFCSKCNGNYEYCNEHLFTHTHVDK